VHDAIRPRTTERDGHCGGEEAARKNKANRKAGGGSSQRLDVCHPQARRPLPEVMSQNTQKKKPPRVKPKHDPRLGAAARELRDRWLERVNDDSSVRLLHGKYEVSRELDVATSEPNPTPLLTAA